MMNNGTYGQFQRGNSCNQGRGSAPCAQPQQRPTGTCNQPQQRPTGSCNQSQQRPTGSCNQSQQRPTGSCNQSQQRPSGSCAQPQQRPTGSCAQPQQRPSSPCNQAPTCPPPTCNQSMRPTPPCNQPVRPSGPSRPCNEMNQEQLLNWISLTKFACVDVSLYLDTHPDDLEAIGYFQEHNRLYNEAMREYAKKYGPLTIAHAHHCDTYWDWVNQPWPWQ